MDQPPTDHSDLPTPTDSSVAQDNLPPGSHPLEVAARVGIGPLSPLGRDLWHGQTRPCVSCGQLVRRDSDFCDYCEQDLSTDMLEKMRAHAGPWYVLEHVRPFPGVNLERILRQIRRGVITETSIVRGPATDYQWRFALETPGLCRYFEKCCNCHEPVAMSDTYCRECMANLTFDNTAMRPAGAASDQPVAGAVPSTSVATAGSSLSGAVPINGTPTGNVGAVLAGPVPGVNSVCPSVGQAGAAGVTRVAGSPASAVASNAGGSAPVAPGALTPSAQAGSVSGAGGANELQNLSAAINQAGVHAREPQWDEPPRVAGVRATWIAVVLLSLVIVTLMWLTDSRTTGNTPTTAPISAPLSTDVPSGDSPPASLP